MFQDKYEYSIDLYVFRPDEIHNFFNLEIMSPFRNFS